METKNELAHNGINLSAVRLINFPEFKEDNGVLCAIEGEINLPFALKRVFMINALNNAVRGNHSHKECDQLLICCTGIIDVTCTDSRNTKTFTLNKFSNGLYIPAGIWAQQKYISPNSTLIVLCSHVYNEDDYIRDYSKYKSSKKLY